MNETIPQLLSYDEPSLDAAFATLADEVRTETSSQRDAEAFRLHWLGRKQGRLKLISDAWLKSAPADARIVAGASEPRTLARARDRATRRAAPALRGGLGVGRRHG